MSFSANHKDRKASKRYIEEDYSQTTDNKSQIRKRDISAKEYSKINDNKYNHKITHYFQNTYSTSSSIVNISTIKEKEIEENKIDTMSSIKPIDKNIFDNDIFIPKRKKFYQPNEIINNKIISFQTQKNKQIMEFPLFDDSLIFKDINRSFLQDEHDDDGDESSDEKINNGIIYLEQEVVDSIKHFKKCSDKNKSNKKNIHILSREMRFNNI